MCHSLGWEDLDRMRFFRDDVSNCTKYCDVVDAVRE